MRIITEKVDYLIGIPFDRKAMLFAELSITMFHCRLALSLFPDFIEKFRNFPPSEHEAKNLYNDSYEFFDKKGRKDKTDEIFRITFDSVLTKRFTFFKNQEKAFKDFVTDDRKFHSFDKIISDLKKIPSPVDSSDDSSFETLAIDCNDLSRFYSAADRMTWNLANDRQKMQFDNMIYAAEIAGLNLTATANQFIGYWKAKLQRKIASQPGAQAQITSMENRIKRASELVEKKGRRTDSGFEIPKSNYHKIISEVFEYHGQAYQTNKKYRRKISELLSEKYEEKIELILTK